jgi:hypothetical protein
MVTSHINLGYWKRSLNQAFNLYGLDRPYQGYLKEIRAGRWLVFDIPLPHRDDWKLVIDRHHTNIHFERV